MACADFNRCRQVILIVLVLRVYVHVDDLLVFDNLKSAGVFVRDAAVLKTAVCVTFFAVRIGPTNRPICARSDYVCYVLYHRSDCCARNDSVRNVWRASFRFFVPTWGHQAVDQIGGVLLRTGFRHLRS